jgi:RNA polymerase sigma-70 factor (ECF subfamily)
MPADEVRLVARAKNGDPEAFQALIDRYRKAVYTTIDRMVGGWYPNDLDDFAQDVFLKLFRAIPRFDFQRKTKFSTWMYTFVRNYCFDVMKKHAARPRENSLTTPEERGGERGLSDDLPRPPAALLEAERREVVRGALGALPPLLREVVVLRQYEGLRFAEIGRIVGCNEGTAKARFHRARGLLRRRLLPYVREGNLAGRRGPAPPAPEEKPR